MQYRKDKYGNDISILGLGCMRFTRKGTEIIMEKAEKVIREEYPEIADKITLHIPDENSRRVGQSVAAASLPKIG